jgi:hypothetical protein
VETWRPGDLETWRPGDLENLVFVWASACLSNPFFRLQYQKVNMAWRGEIRSEEGNENLSGAVERPTGLGSPLYFVECTVLPYECLTSEERGAMHALPAYVPYGQLYGKLYVPFNIIRLGHSR